MCFRAGQSLEKMAKLKTEEEPAVSCTENPVESQRAESGPVAAAPALIPDFAAACRLLAAPYSCLVVQAHRRHVALPPMFIHKKRSGIQEELNAELLKYSNSLKGVPLAYDDIKIVGHHGDIFDDQGYIHLNVEASFVIFRPKKGEKLVGVINKMGVGHVGCLVHGCFNASVVKPAKLTPEQWRDSGLKVGENLEFEVFQLDADVAGVLLIRGRLEKSRMDELVGSLTGTETEKQVEDAEEAATDTFNTEEYQDHTDDSTPKKKKKHKKRQKDDPGDADLTYRDEDISVSRDVDPNCNSNKHKKKKKKKDERNTDEELPSPTAELPNSDSSGYISDKNSKKRRAPEDTEVDVDLPPAKKKKKTK